MVPWFERPIIYDVRARPSLIQSQSGSRDLQMVGAGQQMGLSSTMGSHGKGLCSTRAKVYAAPGQWSIVQHQRKCLCSIRF